MKKSLFLKHVVIICITIAVLLVGAVGLVVLVDPFFQYHKPLDGIYYTIDNQLSQNPGIAKNFDYDSVMLGSSMTVNFDTDLFAEKMGLNTVKLSYNGAYPKDIDTILALVKESDNEVKEVFVGVDIYTYKKTPGIVAYETPEYLYDNNVWNDISYLLNKEVILNYVINPQIKKESTPLNEIYMFSQNAEFGKEEALATYQPPTEIKALLPEDTYADNITANMEKYILPYIEEMPDTQFTFFFPPYSILYWYSSYGAGNINAEISGEKQIVEMLLKYPNVRIFYFQNQYDYITDLNNYSDYTHYYHDMNNYMTQCFADESCRITEENYENVFEDMRLWMHEVEFEQYLK